MNDYAVIWWIIAGALVLLELLSGSFYLLMLALGAVLGALSAHVGSDPVVQGLIAALCSSAFVFACYLLRRRLSDQRAASDPNLHLDVGETLLIDGWSRDGSAKVRYRGAQWTVVAPPGSEPSPGLHRVTGVVGNRLQVEKL